MAEAFDDAMVAVAEGGDAVSGVAPRRAAADVTRLDDDDIQPALAEQRRQDRADETAADDADVGFDALVFGFTGPGDGILS